MKKILPLLAASAVAAALAGCTSMTPEQCKVADWYQVGLEDGSHGEPPAKPAGRLRQRLCRGGRTP